MKMFVCPGCDAVIGNVEWDRLAEQLGGREGCFVCPRCAKEVSGEEIKELRFPGKRLLKKISQRGI